MNDVWTVSHSHGILPDYYAFHLLHVHQLVTDDLFIIEYF